MKFIRLTAFLLVCTFYASKSFSQEKKGQIYFIRSLNYVGSAIPFKMIIDDNVVCKLKNNRYSVHEVPVGEHSVSVQNTGLSNHHMSRPMTVKVEEGKIVYLTVVNGSELYLQEVTQSSAETVLKRTTQTKDCKPEPTK